MSSEEPTTTTSRANSSIDLPQEIDEFIKESIDFSLGLPISTNTLELKLRASEQARKCLQDQYFLLHSRLKDKDQRIDRARSEASQSALALKKFVEENQKLATEYERAKEAEVRVLDIEDELKNASEELEIYRKKCEKHMVSETRLTEELHLMREKITMLEQSRLQGCSDNPIHCSKCSLLKADDQSPRPHVLAAMPVIAYSSSASDDGPHDSSPCGATLEEGLLDSVLASMVEKDGLVANARAFLEANKMFESYKKLLNMWDRIFVLSVAVSRPSSQIVVSLVAEVKTLQNEKEHLKINLTKAEEEVNVLFEDNNILDVENKKLLRLYNKEKRHSGSGDGHNTSAKSNKRKSSPKRCSPIKRMIEFDSPSSRQPLSPLLQNSAKSRMSK
ncbi:hypothetical protein IFM89_013284 [Coptis chinensis]|uniref:Uncharacterized protein n=1 Tax=Coptis chinensis TaxID=261450 RepID=A0A835MIA3_9MAGN|nr:hypothetical protein IFM89_013284 [Coptis chinensis]